MLYGTLIVLLLLIFAHFSCNFEQLIHRNSVTNLIQFKNPTHQVLFVFMKSNQRPSKGTQKLSIKLIELDTQNTSRFPYSIALPSFFKGLFLTFPIAFRVLKGDAYCFFKHYIQPNHHKN